MARDVFVVSAARTVIGTFGGSLKDSPPVDLATLAVKTALARSGAAADSVSHLAMVTDITNNALYELQRIGGRYAQVTMCIGGGQGIAAIFERA